MHLLWLFISFVLLDITTLSIGRVFVNDFPGLDSPLLQTWWVGLVRLVILNLSVRLLSSYCKIPLWLQGEVLPLSCSVLSLLVPSSVTLSALLSPHNSAEVLYGCWRWDLFILSYLFTMTSAVLWHNLFPKFEKENIEEKTSGSVGRLLVLLRPYILRFLLVAVFLVLSSWWEMAIPTYTGRMTDWILNKEDPSAFNRAITAMSMITIASTVTEFFCDWLYTITMSKIHTCTQGQLLRSILKQEIAFFDSISTGDLMSRVTTDTAAMSESLTSDLSLLMWYFMRAIFLSYYMLILSPKLTLFTILCLCVITLVPKLMGNFYQKQAVKVQESLSKANQVAMETISNMKTVRSFANEEGECRRYESKLHDTFQLNKREAVAYGCSSLANSMTSLALKVGILYFGGRLVTRGEVSGGSLVSFVLYELQFTSAIEVLMRFYPDVKKAVGSSEKIFEYMDRIPKITLTGNLTSTIKGHVQFQNVKFAYPTRTDTLALQDVSFELRPGEVTALVGSCDAGKSTIVQLLLRFYEPQAGNILLDGKPLSEYENSYYRKKVTVVSQEPTLFARSLQDNIAYGIGDVPCDTVKQASEMMNAHGFIENMADGYRTDAGQKGGLLSGGQKQRVALARALLRDPQVLILDDATSALDTESEHKVRSTLFDGPRHRTVLIISHRISMVEKADQILVMEGGRIVEQGKHERLLAKKGSYWKLWDKNLSSFQRKQETTENL